MLLRTRVLLAGLTLAAASAAQGQGCVINTESPAELAGAHMNYTRLIDLQSKQQDKQAHFADGIRGLVENADKIQNQVGRWYMVGKLYSAWLSLGAEGHVADADTLLKKSITTRKMAGLSTDPKGKHDLFMALDSAFNKVDALSPGCIDSTRAYRERVYSVVYNAAKAVMDEKKYDSTIALAKRALVVDPSAVAPWNLMAQAYELKGDTAAYITSLIKVTTVSSDTVTARVRQQAHFNLAVLYLGYAKTRPTDAARRGAADTAIAQFKAYSKLNPNDPRAQTGLAGAYRTIGDTASANAIVADMRKNPDQFTANALFEAAVLNFQGQQYDAAIDFFEHGLLKNPYHRDALFGLISTLVAAKQFDKAADVLHRLFAVDPSNQLNVQQALNVWRGVNQAGANAALKAVATDSAIFYAGLLKSLPASVAIAAFTPYVPDPATATVQGSILNKGTAPASFVLEFEFITEKGVVVGRGTATVADVAPNSQKPFSVSVKTKGAVAWRYKIS